MIISCRDNRPRGLRGNSKAAQSASKRDAERRCHLEGPGTFRGLLFEGRVSRGDSGLPPMFCERCSLWMVMRNGGPPVIVIVAGTPPAAVVSK
jgi:hypothetical protein